MKNNCLIVLIVLISSACASVFPTSEPVQLVDRPKQPGPPSERHPADVNPPSMNFPPIINGGNILSKRSIYFDYDSNAVKDEYHTLVQAHSRYLVDNKNVGARIEGNTDERGSREYNLALGQRRADAIWKIMSVFGVPEERVVRFSYGEEKPKNPGHDESAWLYNRRADIVYKGE